ncbi:condensin complex subunit 1 [Periplaneta americana]|uniref:condensin complex subunit 1 n=1 Tax=Periplaneta americana TaxID=6978 RepID=UPI0037E90EF7
MADVEFVIPTNKDELLQEEPGRYCVTNVCSIPDLSGKLSECKNAINEVGTDFIIDHFDALFSVLVHFKQADFSTLSKGWNIIMKGCSVLQNSLTILLDEGDFDNDLRFKMVNITKMTAYILVQMMQSFEDKLSQKPGVLLDTGRGRKKNKNQEYDDFNWESKSHGALVLLYNILQLPLNKLWEPPIAEEEFVNLIANSCYKTLENPGITAAKLKYMRETIFQVLGVLIKRYSHGLSCSIKIVHMLKLYDHLVSPLAQGVVQLVREFGCRTIVRELVREIGDMDSSDLMQDTSGTKSFAQFLVEVAESVPELIVPAIDTLTVHLDGESPAMRMCVLGIMGEIVLRMLSVENLDEKSRDMRDQFLDNLEDHLHDVNAFVRVKVIQIWQRLCREKSIPLSRQSQVLKLVVGRLQDKSSNVKKNAIHLVTTFLEGNPFAAKLTLQELQSQLQAEKATLETLKGKSGSEEERRKHLTEHGRQKAWLEREAEITKVIEDVLKTGSREEEPATQVLTQNSLAEALEEIRVKLGQKEYLQAYYLLRNAEKQFPGAEQLRCEMQMEDQVVYFMNLLHKIFVECNSSEESSQQSSQSSETAGTASQESDIVSQEGMAVAIETQKTVVQYLKDTINFVQLISDAVPVICQLLHSRQNSDIIEAVDFFTSAFQFGLADAITGVRQMLVLVWSRDQAIKDAVAAAYKKLYLTTQTNNPRAHAVQVVKNLSSLLKIVNMDQHAALEELVTSWVANGSIDKACIQVLWERFSMNIPDTSEDDSLAALILLGIAAKAEVQTVSSNISVLVSIGLGERGRANYRLVKETCQVLLRLAVRKPSTNSKEPALRFPRDHEIFTNITDILKSGLWNMNDDNYICMSAEAIDVIYQLAEQPDIICGTLLQELIAQVKLGKAPENEFDALLEEPSQKPSEPSSEVPTSCPVEVMSRLVFMIGHVSLRHMLYLDIAVFCELKRRNFLREERDEAANIKNKKKKRQSRGDKSALVNASYVSASETPRNRQDPSEDDEMGVVGAVADDQEAEYILNVCENDIVTGENLLASLSPLLVTICTNPKKYSDIKLQTAASLSLAKMMMVSSTFCDEHLQLLVTVMEKSTEPAIRSNLIVSLGALAYRFPNITEPWTPHIYGRLRDSSCDVREGTMMVLTQLIMNDMIKVKGQISEIALCIVDSEEVIADMAQTFFRELAQKGNALYNVMPDIISRLSTPDSQLKEENFKTIMKFIMPLIQKDRQMESLVEKLCLRFRLSQSERQWCDLSYCLSLLQYSDRSLRRLSENLSCYADKLHSPKVYEIFNSILTSISKTTKPELKAVVDELDAKIKELNQKGTDDAMLSQKASEATNRRRTTANTPSGNRISSVRKQMSRSTVRRKRRTSSDSEDSDGSFGDNSDKENDGSKSKSRSQTRSSMRLKTAVKLPPIPQPILESDESDEDDAFVKPKVPPVKSTPAVSKKITEKSDSSDEETADSELMSPDRKRLCSEKGNKRKSVNSTPKPNTAPLAKTTPKQRQKPQTRSTPQSVNTPRTRSATKPRTRRSK